jgi:hypothetical protein
MPKFSDVFSTTWKALLALFLISLGVTFVWLVIAAIGNTKNGSTSDEWRNEVKQKNADEAPTKMPKSQWDREIQRCIKEHTLIEGMSKDEVRRAVGGEEPWTYSIVIRKGTDQNCIRYAGEDCAEYPPDETKTFSLHFTPTGNLIWDDDSIGLSVYGKHTPEANSEKPRRSSRLVTKSGTNPMQPGSMLNPNSAAPRHNPCEYIAVTKNGFMIRHRRRGVIGEKTRLYLSNDSASFVDVPTGEIDHIASDSPSDCTSSESDSR